MPTLWPNTKWHHGVYNYSYSEAKASVPGATNKLGEWLTDWVRDFSVSASSAMEAAKERKFGTEVA